MSLSDSKHPPSLIGDADIFPRPWRRRSADIGGLSLATGSGDHGQGWMGHSGELETGFAELLSDMYKQTIHAVNEQHVESVPANLSAETRSHLIKILDRWDFEPYDLPEDERLACTLLLFELLFQIEGMASVIPVSMQQISAFVHHLRRIYRLENSYHNFEHALDVLQATYSYLRDANMVPSVTILSYPDRTWRSDRIFDDGSLVTTLRPAEIFILFIAAIGHDVGHPGFTNYFIKVAEAPLSKVYDGQSPLEHMHYQLLLRIMHHHGLGVLFNDHMKGAHLRRLLLTSVLVTDMSVHENFMDRLQHNLSHEQNTLCARQTLLSQALLKCADISNPSRPYSVSQHWATALMQEWAKQAMYEKSLAFKPSVQESTSPLKEARSQVFFIEKFAQPLLQLTVQAVPEMKKYLKSCARNKMRWIARVQELEEALPPGDDNAAGVHKADDYINVFPLALPHSRQATGDEVSTSDSGLTSPSGSEISNISPVNLLMLEEHAAIRAAGKMGVRQQQKNFHRNSWSPAPLRSHFAGTQPLTSSPLAHVQETGSSSSSNIQ
ncbi:hypothetical protein AX15_000376 [Amanita polypyramis BW_CC]|nr:hypothetical protein AX15_000376 [Amanita polypyramis BW_CC]